MGKAAIATGWSGNEDYMPADRSFRVDYTLQPVPAGAYPHSDGQQWAEPDNDHARRLMRDLLDNPADAAVIRRAGMLYVRTHFSNRAVGLRMVDALKAVSKMAEDKR